MPFPAEWTKILRRNFPIFFRLPEELRAALKERMLIFLDEKSFEGCNGLTVTQEMRVSIAAQACLLLLNKEQAIYPGLHTILLYPDAFQSVQKEQKEHGVMEEKVVTRVGESWTRGHIVLSWKHSKRGGKDFRDGHNVVLHEFSHQLDQLDGSADGIPNLEEGYQEWVDVLGRRFRQVTREWKSQRKKPFLREYGITNAAEFFAVSTELFFERPARFRKEYPDLYAQLKFFYQLDPSQW